MLADVPGQSQVSPFNRLTSMGVFKSEPLGKNPKVQRRQDSESNCDLDCRANDLAPGRVNLYEGRFLLGRSDRFQSLWIAPEIHH